MRVVALALAYFMLCDGILCRSLAYDRSLHRRHETHHIHHHSHTDSLNEKLEQPNSLDTPPYSTNPSDSTSNSMDILNSIISLLFSPATASTTATIVPLFPITLSGKASVESATIAIPDPNHTTVDSSHTKTANHHHTTAKAESTVGATQTHHSTRHAVNTKPAMNTTPKLAAQETKSPHKHVNHQHNAPSQNIDQDQSDDDDDGSDGGSGNDNNHELVHLTVVTPSATTVNTLPSLTTSIDNPSNTQTDSETVQAERTNKNIGIVVGLGCVVIGAAGLAGVIISRRQDKARQVIMGEGDVQTRWRPQSFLAVVATAVSRFQQTCSRDNSVKSNTASEHRQKLAEPAAQVVETA